jgi:hypothetical protein
LELYLRFHPHLNGPPGARRAPAVADMRQVDESASPP